MRSLALFLMLLGPAAARAQDEAAPPPPATNPPPLTPRVAGLQPAPIDEDRIERIVDAAVERALARRLPAAMQQAGYQQSATQRPATATYASSQAAAPARATSQVTTRIVEAPVRQRIEYAPVIRQESQYARVLIPAPCHRRAAAAVGQRLVEYGAPRTKLMRIAPAEVQTVQTVTVASTPATRQVYATSQSD